jgi:hypothetical protein
MSSKWLMALTGVVGVVVGFALHSVLAEVRPRGDADRPPSSGQVVPQVAASQLEHLGALERRMAQLGSAIDRLSESVAAGTAAAHAASLPVSAGGSATSPRDDEDAIGAVRDLGSPLPLPNEQRLSELSAASSDGTHRRRLLFAREHDVLQHLGGPSRVWTAQGGSAEYWEYETASGQKLTLVFHRGRLIDVR